MTDNIKSMTTYSQELIQKARELAGTSSSIPKVSYIKINYDEDQASRGEFILKKWNKERELYEDKLLGPSFEGVILAYTKKCSQWDADTDSNLYESNEFQSYDEVVTLLSNNEVVSRGKYRELKNRYSDLRLQLILYVLIDNAVVKFFIKGKTIMEFGSYEKIILENKAAIQGFKTSFSTRKEQNGAVNYFVTEFKQGEVQDLEKMVELSMKVREGLKLIRERFNQTYSLTDSQNLKEETAVEVIEAKQIPENDDLPTDLPF